MHLYTTLVSEWNETCRRADLSFEVIVSCKVHIVIDESHSIQIIGAVDGKQDYIYIYMTVKVPSDTKIIYEGNDFDRRVVRCPGI